MSEVQEITQVRLNDYARNAMTAAFPQDVRWLVDGGRELVFDDMANEMTIVVKYGRDRNIVCLSYFHTESGRLHKEYRLERRERQLREQINSARGELEYQRHICQTTPVAELSGKAAAEALRISRNMIAMQTELQEIVSNNHAV